MNVPLAPSELWRRIGTPRRVVAVVAHPDDESFGLGAVLSGLVDEGSSVAVVCFTHGEASTLGLTANLGALRELELRAAADELGIAHVALFDYPDGHLGDAGCSALCERVDAHLSEAEIDDSDLVVAFEPSGVTGHPDHRAATAVARALAVRQHIPLLEWGLAASVASTLQAELGAPFGALTEDDSAEVLPVTVDRRRQLAAIARHRSQAVDNKVLTRRLEVQGAVEHVRWRPVPAAETGWCPESYV